MLELTPTVAAVVSCMSDAPDALDALARPVGGLAVPGRVAADEVLLFGARSDCAEILQRATAVLAGSDPHALILDQSDGWAGWTIGGAADEAFARLSAVSLRVERPAFLQGAVAGVQGKILLRGSEIAVFAPSTLRDHVAARIAAACSDLGVEERPAREFDASAAATPDGRGR